MKQSTIALWLKGICLLIGLIGIGFFMGLVPYLGIQVTILAPAYQKAFIPSMICAYLIGVFCYMILFQFWKVCDRIGRKESFSLTNVSSFVWMSRFSLGISCLSITLLMVLSLLGLFRPGVILFLLTIFFIGLSLTVLTAALAHLIRNAYELQQEHDLTI